MSGATVSLKMISGERYAVPKLKSDPILKGEIITVDSALATVLLEDFWIDAAQNEQPYFKECIEGEEEPAVKSATRTRSAPKAAAVSK